MSRSVEIIPGSSRNDDSALVTRVIRRAATLQAPGPSAEAPVKALHPSQRGGEGHAAPWYVRCNRVTRH